MQCGRPGFEPWVGKISWRRERLPTAVFWPGESYGRYSPWDCKELYRTERLSLSIYYSVPCIHICVWIYIRNHIDKELEESTKLRELDWNLAKLASSWICQRFLLSPKEGRATESRAPRHTQLQCSLYWNCAAGGAIYIKYFCSGETWSCRTGSPVHSCTLDIYLLIFWQFDDAKNYLVIFYEWSWLLFAYSNIFFYFPSFLYVFWLLICYININKEIKPVNPKGNQPWVLRTDAEAEAPVFRPPDVKSQLIGKNPDSGKDWGQEEKAAAEDGMVGWHHWLSENHIFSEKIYLIRSENCRSQVGRQMDLILKFMLWSIIRPQVSN